MPREDTKRHEVYPGELAEEIERAAEEEGMSLSGFYREAARRQLSQLQVEQ